MMPPPMMPVSTSRKDATMEPAPELVDDENLSDIVSISGADDTKEVRVKPASKRRKKEITL